MTREEIDKILTEKYIVSLHDLGASFAFTHDDADEFNELELQLLSEGYINGFIQGYTFAKTGDIK